MYISLFCLLLYPGFIAVFLSAEIFFRKLISKSTEASYKDFTYADIDEEVKRGRVIFVYENTVIDMSKYMTLHPGTNLLKDYIGTEISRYIYGGFSCGKGFKYLHSDSTLKIVEKLNIGQAIPGFSLISKLEASKRLDQTYSFFEIAPNVNDLSWKLTGREKASSVHQIMKFSSNPYKTAGIIPGINHCGCYITVLSKRTKVTRNYSFSCMNNQELYKAHVELPKALAYISEWVPLNGRMESYMKDNLEICVKKQRLLSKWLHEMDFSEDEFEIRGPFVLNYFNKLLIYIIF